jgi:hypothetical protein
MDLSFESTPLIPLANTCAKSSLASHHLSSNLAQCKLDVILHRLLTELDNVIGHIIFDRFAIPLQVEIRVHCQDMFQPPC